MGLTFMDVAYIWTPHWTVVIFALHYLMHMGPLFRKMMKRVSEVQFCYDQSISGNTICQIKRTTLMQLFHFRADMTFKQSSMNMCTRVCVCVLAGWGGGGGWGVSCLHKVAIVAGWSLISNIRGGSVYISVVLVSPEVWFTSVCAVFKSASHTA